MFREVKRVLIVAFCSALAVAQTAEAGSPELPSAAQAHAAITAAVAPSTPGSFVPLAPQRLLDTRSGAGAPKTPVPAGTTITLQLTGQGPAGNKIPDHISAVAINITATNSTASGYLTAYPGLTPRPGTSTLGFAKSQTVANFAIVPVGTNGTITLYNGGPGTTDIIGDIAGYYLTGTPTEAGTLAPLAPQRLLDTRSGAGAPKTPVPAGTTITLQLTGQGPAGNKIPDHISAVAINITATNSTASGYLTAYPGLTPRPGTSTLGFAKSQTVANFAIVPVGTNGTITLYNGGPGTTDIIGDIAGYYLTGTPTEAGTLAPLAPQRLLDTRSGAGAPKTPVPAGTTITLQLTGQGPAGNKIPDHISAVAINITATNSTASGYLTAYPGLTPRPGTSTLGFAKSQTVANFAIVPVGTNGTITLYNGGPGTTDIIGDIAGYYLVATVVPPDTDPPGPVTGLSTGSITSTGLTLRWTNPGGDFTGALVRRSIGTVAPASPTQGTQIASTAAGITSFADTGLAPGTTYSYAVFAHDAVPNYAAGATISATTTPPATGTMTWSAPTAIDPLHGAPTSLSCPSTAFCAAVDSMGNALTYSSGWSKPMAADTASAQAGGLTSVSCVSATFCLAVDAAGRALTFNGSAWSAPANTQTTARLNSVSCASTSFCAAVGSGGVATTVNGTVWKAATVDAGQPLAAVSCPTTMFCVAVDAAGRALTWNGTLWSTPKSMDSNGSMTSIDCVSTTFCVAVDSVQNSDFSTTGHAVTYNGTAWSAPVVADSTAGLASVSCTGAGACSAVDDAGGVVTLAAGKWTRTTTEAASFAAISCPSATSCTAIDTFGSAVQFDPYGWHSPVGVDLPNTLTSVSCSSAAFCTAVGMAGQSVTYNGTTWAAPAIADSNGGLNGVSCVSASFCTAVGLVDAVNYGGTAWTPSKTIAAGRLLTSISCRSAAFCVATGNDGSAVVQKSGTWSAPQLVDDGQSLNAVSCASTTFCIGVDDAGQAVTFNGTTWTGPVQADSSADNALVSVSCPTATFCAAVDVGGSVVRYNGTKWSSPVSITAASATSVSCSSAARCTAVDTAGNAIAFDGTTWAAPVAIDPGSAFLGGLTAVSCPTDDFCTAIEQAGWAVQGHGGPQVLRGS